MSVCLPSAAADQSAGDGKDEGGAREEEVLPGARGPQGEGLNTFQDSIQFNYDKNKVKHMYVHLFQICSPQERKTMTHSASEPPASSTPSLSRSSSISGTDNACLHTFILSQVNTRELKFQHLEIKTNLCIT